MLPIVLYNIPYLFVKCVNTVSQQKKRKRKTTKDFNKKGSTITTYVLDYLTFSSYTLHTTVTIRLK